MSQSILNKAVYARTMNGVITLSDGTLTIENGNITNATNINTGNIKTSYLQTNILDISGNVVIDGTLNVKSNATMSGQLTTISGNTLMSGSLVTVSGNITSSGVLTQTGNILASGSIFRYTRTSGALTVINRNWTDGSGAVPATNTKTTMFDVSNGIVDVSGWRFGGTVAAGSGITPWGAWWLNGSFTGYNDYGSPSAGNGPYYCIFYCYSPGTNQNNSTFYIESRTPLSKGLYVANWQSKFNAGTQYSTTSLNVSVDGGVTTLLSYNDSDTRSTNIYRSRTLVFEVKADNSYMRWTYRDTQAISNQFFAATIQGLTITKHNGMEITDNTLTTFVAPNAAQLYNTLMNGTNIINGTLSMSGIPSFRSSVGTNNVCMTTNFTQATGASASSNNIAIGEIGFYGVNYQNTIMLGQNSFNDGSNPNLLTLGNVIAIGNDLGGAKTDDVIIGYGIKASGGGTDNVLIGSLIANNATSSQPFTRCVAVGSRIWRAYYFQTGANPPQDNVAVGAYSQGQSGDLIGGSFNTSMGSYSMTWIKGNINTQSYNTSVGYYSGADTTGNFNNYYGCSYFGALSKSTGTVASIRFASTLGYNTIADASYCTVIGADASYNVANTIRLGRSIDTTVASILTVIGNTTTANLTTNGNITINNASSIRYGGWNSTKLDLSSCDLQVESMFISKCGTTITTTTTITKPFAEVQPVEVTGTAYTITLPSITFPNDLGKKIIFRKVKQTGTLVTISFIVSGGLQKVYNSALIGGLTAQALFTSSLYTITFIALPDTTTGAGAYAWFML